MKYDIYVVMIGRFFQMIISVFLLKIMTTQLNAVEMGKYSIIISLVSFFSLICISPVGMYFNRKLHEWYQNGVLPSLLLLYTYYIGGIAVVADLVISVAYYFSGVNWNVDIFWLTILLGGSLIGNTLNQTIIPSLNMLGKRVDWAILTSVTLVLSLLASLLLVGIKKSAEFWIMGQLIGVLLGSFIALIPFWRLMKKQSIAFCSMDFSWNSRNLKPILSFSVPIAVTVGLSWVQFQSYRFIVTELSGLEYLGLFIAGYTVSSGIMGAFESTAMSYFSPIFYSKIANSDDYGKIEIWEEYASFMIPLTLYTAITISFMATQLTHILVGHAFWSAAKFVTFAAMIESGRIIGNIYSMLGHAMMQTKVLVKPQVIGATSIVLLVPCFVLLFPDLGLGIALVIAAVLFTYLMHSMTRDCFGSKLSWINVTKKMIFILPIIVISTIYKLIDGGLASDISCLVLSGIIYCFAAYKLMRNNFAEIKINGG